MNWFAYCRDNPLNAVDPDGRNIVVLNNSTAVNLGPLGTYGHNACIVGNDRDGWTYYSKYDDPGARINKDDGPEGIYDSRTTTSNGNYKQSYDTLQDFYNDQAVSGQYNRSVEIITTPAQDAAMKNTGNKIYDTPYDLATNNCADLVENITFSGKINLYSDFLGFGSITIPNDQYKVAEGIAESSSGYSTNDDLNYNTMRVNFKISSKK